MFARCTRLAALLAASLLCPAPATSADSSDPNQNWPAWRGPLATGSSPAADPPTKWSEDQNIKWKVQIPGRGQATPIIWGDRVFIQTAIATGKKIDPPAKADKTADVAEKAPGEAPKDRPGPRRPGANRPPQSEPPYEYYQFVLMCLDRKTGQTRWQKIVREEAPHEGFHPGDGSFASSSPVADGQRVYADFGSRGIYAFDLDGNPVWDKDLGKMQMKLGFGEGSSPALYKNTLVLTWDHEGESFIVAFDATTGHEIWRTPRESESVWATPLVVEVEGKPQVVASAENKIRSYDLADGKLLWECAGLTTNAIPSPVAAAGLVYLTTGFRGPVLLAINPGATGDITGTDAIAWTYKKDTPYVPSPLLYDGRLYFFQSNRALLSCLDAKTGKAIYGPERIEGLDNAYASPVAAAGRIYLVGRNGTTAVIRPGDKLDIIETNKLDEGIDASPALAGTELFLRGKEHLYCISEK
jgi:outer membrane protein assembly factor BamB